MPEQARSAERPNEEQSDEWLDRLVSCGFMLFFQRWHSYVGTRGWLNTPLIDNPTTPSNLRNSERETTFLPLQIVRHLILASGVTRNGHGTF